MAEHVEDSMAMQYIGNFPFPIATWPLAGSEDAPKDIDILDIRSDKQEVGLDSDVQSKLHISDDHAIRESESRFWKDKGTEAHEKLTLDHADSIATSLMPGAILIDLDSGTLQQTKYIIEAIESHHKIVDYFALSTDIERLKRVLQALDPTRFNYVRCHGLLGSEEEGRTWIVKYENKQRPVCVLALGSTIDAVGQEDLSAFWKRWSELLTVNNEFNSNNARIILGFMKSDGDNQMVQMLRSSNLKQLQRYMSDDGVHGLDVLAPC